MVLHLPFPVELEFENVGFCGEGKTGLPGEKNFAAKERSKKKLNPHMASTPGFEPTLVKASALTTSPLLTLFPVSRYFLNHS